jgi:hypothetical protein
MTEIKTGQAESYPAVAHILILAVPPKNWKCFREKSRHTLGGILRREVSV